MRLVLLFFFSLIFSLSVRGQFEYNITTTPDSVDVYLNGEKKCTTPCSISFYWKEANDNKIEFSARAPGFKTWTDSIVGKPFSFDFRKHVEMERIFPEFDLDSSTVIVAYDKLFADFKTGSVIGTYTNTNLHTEDLKWEGNIRVGSEDFEEKFYTIMSNAGFLTPYSEGAKLFSGKGERNMSLPRYLVGIQLIDYDVQLIEAKNTFSGTGRLAGKTQMVLEWQIFDNATERVVLTDTTKGVARYRKSSYNVVPDNLLAFEDGLINFLNNRKLHELVSNAEKATSFTIENAEIEHRNIGYIPPRKFESQGEMIQFASEACVTVLTDGGHGSGVIIDDEGLVLTANHVVAGVNRIDVKFSNGLKLQANVIAANSDLDVALLDVSGSGFRALPVNLSQETSLGQELMTIGTPADVELGQSIAKGYISGKRKIDGHIFIQLDLAVSPGNSGGPLLNKNGEIEGIVLRKIIGTGVEGIGFGVPIQAALEALNISVTEEE